MTNSESEGRSADNIETSAAEKWVEIKPKDYARFGVYNMEPTRIDMQVVGDNVGVAAWRTEKRGRTYVRLAPDQTYVQWAMLRAMEHFFLFVENQSETSTIRVRTGQVK